MKYSQRWRQTSIANRMLVISSCFMAFATGFLAIGAVVQYFTLRGQLRTMQEQQATARRSMIVGSRAYIGVNSIQTDLKRGQLTFWLENIGKVPATNIKADAATAMPKNAQGWEGFEVMTDQLLDLGINELFPGTFKLPVVVWIKDFTPETESLILTRQRVLYVMCNIEYDNGFEGESKSSFLFYYLPPPDDKWIPRGLVRDSKNQQGSN